ncbi:MAG: C4-dicarboxylate ABC transporter [Chromatiales bacterium 21-64-14]|nr:MAG: C4-dicarboxylate ABC transporter [Chromatiales bacterium 21-64-14]HQU16040.1 TRAP transporter large permease [Gammaproteobacteria bacterium]
MNVAITLLLIAAALLGLPLFVVLGALGLVASWRSGVDPAVLIVEMHSLAASANLVAIPLFTLVGSVLAAGGAPQRLVRVFNAVLGWMPGGLAIVALSSCAFFTAFSGASGVTILALGGLLYPILTTGRYPERFSLGLVTSSGSLGLLFMPSLPLLLYGIVAKVGIDDLFKAGVVPGLLLMVLLGGYSMVTGRRAQVPRQEFSVRELRMAAREGIWDLMLPIGILVGIFRGYVTVTEAASCAAAYVLFVEIVVHRTLKFDRHLLTTFREAAVLVGSILIILSVAMGLTNLLVNAQIPAKVLSYVEHVVHSPLQFLLLLNLMLLVVGAIMDVFSAIMVVVPLILPLALRFGVDPVHLGIIFLANLEIGYSTPPVGLNLFIASQRFDKPVFTLFRSTLPFLAIMIVWLAVLTYVPALSLWWRGL